MESASRTAEGGSSPSRSPLDTGAHTRTTEERLQHVEEQLDRLTRLMEANLAWQRKLTDFVEEMTPVARAVMDTATGELAGLERQGYFQLAGDLREAAQRLVESYEPGSLPALASSFGDAVFVMRLVSQPRILAAVQDVAQELEQARPEPVEVLGATRRIETEKDIQRGIAVALDLFGTLGRSVARAPRLGGGRKSVPVPQTRTAVVRPEPAVTTAPEDFPFVEDWSRVWAERKAESLGVGPLGDDRWQIVEFARKEYLSAKKAPNLRRITQALQVPTRDVYALFPAAPGPTISKLAGIPKPAGCL